MDNELDENKFEMQSQSMNYKKFINRAKYGDTVDRTTNEYVIFDYNDKNIKISFEFKFSYNFDDGFNYTQFTHKKTSRKIDSEIEDEMIYYIKKKYPDLHHLSY